VKRRLLAFALALTVAETAFAQTKEPRTVEVVLVGGKGETGALVDTMRELFGRLGLVPDVRTVAVPDEVRAAPRGSVAARVEIDLRSDKDTSIVAFGRDGIPHRRTLRRDPSPSIAREELAHAIQTVVEAQVRPDAPATTDAPNPAPKNVPRVDPMPAPTGLAALAPSGDHDSVPPKVRSPVAIDVNMLAGGGGFGDNAGAVMRVGAGAAVVYRHGLSPSLGIDVHYVTPFDVSSPRVTANASDLVFRAMAGATLYRNTWLALHAGVGGGGDVLMVSARSAVLDAGAVNRQVPTFLDPVVSSMVGADIGIVPNVSVTLRFVVDVDLASNRYFLQHADGSRDVIFNPWNVRPALMLGFNFTPYGPDAMRKR
jgi:hypothetical protein